MQSLLGGADCSTSSNPLKQVLQRETVDNSLLRDRLRPSTGAPAQHAFRTAPGASAGAINGIHGDARSVPHPFNLSHLSAALASSSQRSSPVPAGFEHAWTSSPSPPVVHSNGNVHHAPQGWQMPTSQAGGWASDFQADVKGKGRAPPSLPPSMANGAMGYPSQYGRMPYQPSLSPMYSTYSSQMQPPMNEQGQMGHRSQREQEEMEAAFERALADAQSQSHTGAAAEEVAESAEEDREAKGDFEKVWESLRPEAERLGRLAEWERDFSQFTNDEDDLFDTLNDSLQRDEVDHSGLRDLEGDMPDFASVIEPENGLPRPRAYEFATPNPHLQVSPAEAWIRANHLLNTGASLSEVTLLLESFLQQAQPEHYGEVNATDVEAWSLLGRTHAMNEKEEKALEAFEEGRQLLSSSTVEGDIDSGRAAAAGEMLVNLAISYVNESLDLAALTTLHQFLGILHPDFAGLVPSRTRGEESPSPWALHTQMRDNYLTLAQKQYLERGTVDPDVEVGLGTLYYMMGEYDEARGCWVAALAERPSDYLLWNRLGATLANSGNSEEAVDAYRRALELRPTFTRAIFNLGVACLNIGVHREAAEHFLAALSLHPENAKETSMYESGPIWNTLRRSLIALDLPQLATKAVPGTDLEVFRQAGFEFF